MESYAKRKTSKRGKKKSPDESQVVAPLVDLTRSSSSDDCQVVDEIVRSVLGPAVTSVVGRRPAVGVAAKKTEEETRKANDQELLSRFAKDEDEGESSGLGGGEKRKHTKKKKARLQKDDENPEKESGTGNVKCSAGAS